MTGLENEPWRSDNEGKVAKIVRSMSQDVGRHFKDNSLRKLFPKKIIYDKKLGKKVDVGLVCVEWTYDLLTHYEPSKEKLDAYMAGILAAYLYGTNLDTNKEFHIMFAIDIVPTYIKKIKPFSQITKLSLMDNLNKPKKSSNVKEGDDIQW